MFSIFQLLLLKFPISLSEHVSFAKGIEMQMFLVQEQVTNFLLIQIAFFMILNFSRKYIFQFIRAFSCNFYGTIPGSTKVLPEIVIFFLLA